MERLKLKLHVSSLHPSAATPKKSNLPLQNPQKRSVDELDDGDEDVPTPCARTVSLGSRKQLCINDELRAKSRDLDESCRELLSGSCIFISLIWSYISILLPIEKGDKRCHFLLPFDDETRILDFRDQILVRIPFHAALTFLIHCIKASPKDIEDLAMAGRTVHICPYFGSRRAIPQAEVFSLEYVMIYLTHISLTS
jgi:chromosome transmission fidelity protein 1